MIGISEKTMTIHRDKLYAGYVKKAEEIVEKLRALRKSGKAQGNATFSDLRALKAEETFAMNGVYLHEWYFANISGDGNWKHAPELTKALEEKFGSMEEGIAYMSECGMAARGWAILAWDPKQGRLMQYNADSHNQGGVWGCIPIIVLDVYEHAYFIDFGSDRKAYIEAFWKNFDWAAAEAMYLKVKDIKL
ncbi:MAG: superoxide dismutase [Patescibacteria group bacterium]